MKSKDRVKEKKKSALHKPLKRKLHLSNGTWTYDIGSNYIRILSPDCKSYHKIRWGDFTGNGEHGRYHKQGIWPSDIMGYIRREFLGEDPDWKYDSSHREALFAEKYEIKLIETTSAGIQNLMEQHKRHEERQREEKEKRRAELVLRNIDLFLEFTDHSFINCDDAKPLEKGLLPHDTPGISQGSPRRVECSRCFLLSLKERGKWDENFIVRVWASRKYEFSKLEHRYG